VKEFIGVKHLIGIDDTASIKQEALMFDRIAVLRYKTIAPMLRKGSCPTMSNYYDDLDWLLDQGIIFEPENIKPTEALLKDEEYQRCKNLLDENLSEFSKLPGLMEKGFEGKEEEAASAVHAFFMTNYYDVRHTTLLLREVRRMDAYPIFSMPCGCPPFESETATKNDVIEISLKALPMPDYSTPWEQILEYRSDTDSRIKFSRLRHWMSKVAHTQNRPNEIEEEFETLVHEYSQHMELHKLKTRLDTLKAIVVAEVGLFTGGWLSGLGALPGIAGIIATPLYSMKQRKAELTAAELKAPGKEIAYIVESNQAFPNRDELDGSVCPHCGGGDTYVDSIDVPNPENH
jgi:hypothetical protein